jgi:hypothetical protein
LLDHFPIKDPKNRDIDDLVKQFATKNIQLNALEITDLTKKMFREFNKQYSSVSGQNINFGKLDSSTKDFSFFVTSTISNSIAKSSSNLKSSCFSNHKEISIKVF